jgi:predicted small metal-binding protein
MRTLSDKDLGIECDFIAEGETDEDVIQEMTDHIEEEHPDELDRVETMMQGKIKES